MTSTYNTSNRNASSTMMSACLEDKFEVLKSIGDGSFGSVVLARVRSAGAHVARRGSVIAIKTMKKTFDSFEPCLELREVIFLRSLPVHPHLVPALEIFLDPLTKKLHICMEYMDGNLYQLMKAREHKCLDVVSVKSILFQILAGLDHIHSNEFFHRDIKPENILVSSSAVQESSTSFRRYSTLITPPSTPPVYTVKIADFGLARETHSKLPYTTYVSTRWYRAPEVLLRAGEYSAPVDIWALGAMAVEIANLKPLFPGGNEVDQVWRVCEIMGSPGNWYNKSGGKVGGGDWKDGTRLAQKLGFSFPKMAPHSMDTILPPPQWPLELSNFVTWCLMWDPKNRPTSAEAMNHEYFADAVDPLRPKSSASRFLGKKHTVDAKIQRDPTESPPLTSKPSWFRKSLITRESAPAIPQHTSSIKPISPRPTPIQSNTISEPASLPRPRGFAIKRATWTNGNVQSNAAPMPILPTIRPISPLSDAVTAQANSRLASEDVQDIYSGNFTNQTISKKIGRQLSVASNNNHYADAHRQEAERALIGDGGPVSPTTSQREGFFSHLRKRARRISGRQNAPVSPNMDDIEANAGCAPWASNRSSIAVDSNTMMATVSKVESAELDKALQNVRSSLEASVSSTMLNQQSQAKQPRVASPELFPKRMSSLPKGHTAQYVENGGITSPNLGPISSRTRRALHASSHPSHRYETPDEEDELLVEALDCARRATRGMRKAEVDSQRTALARKDGNRQPTHTPSYDVISQNPYPTPSSSGKRSGIHFSQGLMNEPATPLHIAKARPNEDADSHWPTPPYEENEWAASAAASIFAASNVF